MPASSLRPLRLLTAVLAVCCLPPAAGGEEAPERRLAGPWLGVGVVELGEGPPPAEVLELLEGLGPVFVEIGPIPWGTVEPHEAELAGRRLRDFSLVDETFRAWRSAGFEVVPVLSPASPWACPSVTASPLASAVADALPKDGASILAEAHEAAVPPQGNRWDDWEAFVETFVERYDGDGQEDVAGPATPLRFVRLVDLPDHPAAWAGDASAYLRLLHHAGLAIDRAAPGTRLIHGTIDTQGLGHPPIPDDEMLGLRRQQRDRGIPPALAWANERAVETWMQTLELPRLYRGIAHRGSANLHDERHDLSYLRTRLVRAQAGGLEVWLTGSPWAKLDEPAFEEDPQASPAEQRRRTVRAAAARDVRHGEHEAARRWQARGRAYDVVRTIVSARAAGADRVVFGDVKGTEPPWASLVEGPVVPSVDPRRQPAYFALRQAASMLGDHLDAEARPFGGGRLVRFSMPDAHDPPWVAVAWLDPEASWAEGDTAEPALSVLPLDDGEYVVEDVALSAEGPSRRDLKVEGGVARLRMGAGPVYIHPRSPDAPR